MKPTSDADIKAECPHCGQHVLCGHAWIGHPLVCPGCQAEFIVVRMPATEQESEPGAPEFATPASARQFRCPRCGAELGVFLGDGRTKCGRCGWERVVEPEHPDLPGTPAQRVVTGITLFVIGAASPCLVLAAMAATLVSGPLAIILAPVVGLLVAIILCGFIYQRTGPRWYWYYAASGMIVPLLILVWPENAHSRTNGNEAAAFAVPGMAVGALMGLVAVVLWLLAVAYAWIRARQD